jgi:hypothetical protein
MKLENFERGKVIQAEILRLENHLKLIFDDITRSNKKVSLYEHEERDAFFSFNVPFSSRTGERELIPHFYPFSIENFMTIYKSNVEKRIAELQEEFSKL